MKSHTGIEVYGIIAWKSKSAEHAALTGETRTTSVFLIKLLLINDWTWNKRKQCIIEDQVKRHFRKQSVFAIFFLKQYSVKILKLWLVIENWFTNFMKTKKKKKKSVKSSDWIANRNSWSIDLNPGSERYL